MTLDLESSPVFREQARAWLTLNPRSGDRSPQVLPLGKQFAVVAEFVDCPPNFLFREPLLVRGDFQCGAGSRFEAPCMWGGIVPWARTRSCWLFAWMAIVSLG